jgi:hypothetical protein
MHLWGLLQERSFSPEARVAGDLPCAGCGYNLREAQAAGVCPECGAHVRDSLAPLHEPDKVASALRCIGNSYLGLLALPLVPLAMGVASSCAGWAGVLVLLMTSVTRAFAVAELRFKAATDKLPVIGARIGLLWLAVVVDVVLVAALLLLLLAAAAANDQARDWATGLALASLVAWLGAASAVAVVAGWMGAALAAMLGHADVARRLRVQWMLMAAGPAVAVGFFVLSLMMGAIGGAGAAAAMGLFALFAVGLLWLIGICLTLARLSELARVAERTRDPRQNIVSEM